MEQVKLLSMTTVLTLLVWASADSLVNETVSLDVTLTPVPAPGSAGLLVEAGEGPSLFEVRISGPRKSIAAVQAQVPLDVRLAVPDQPTGPAEIQLDRDMLKRELAAQYREFRKLTVVSVLPASMNVKVDHWVTRDVDLALERLTLTYQVAPQLPRRSVTVTMRESRLTELEKNESLRIDITADLERRLKERPSGEGVRVTLPLDTRPFGADARLSPNAITVTATVMTERLTQEITTVPILFAVSSINLEKPLRPVTRDGTPLSVVTRTITATGPTDIMTRLARGEQRVYGLIQLKQDDLEDPETVKIMTPDIRLPPGVELVKDPDPVEFKLINASTTGSRG